MASERFQYLFNRYKTGQLSELDNQVFQEMIMGEDHNKAIGSDIEAYMKQYLRHDWARKQLLDAIWEKITTAIPKI